MEESQEVDAQHALAEKPRTPPSNVSSICGQIFPSANRMKAHTKSRWSKRPYATSFRPVQSVTVTGLDWLYITGPTKAKTLSRRHEIL